MRKDLKIKKKIIEPDFKYCDQRISKLINFIMLNGEKAKAEKIV